MDNDIFSDVQEGGAGLSAVGRHAGFPNPAAQRDHQRPTLSLDRLLIKQPSSTYLFRIQGHRWAGQGIVDGDIAIVDRSLTPRRHDMVVRWDDSGTLCLERFTSSYGHAATWGVVRAVIHQYRGGR